MTHNDKKMAALDVAIGFDKNGMWSNSRYTRNLLDSMVDEGLLKHEESRGVYSRYTITDQGRQVWREYSVQRPLVVGNE